MSSRFPCFHPSPFGKCISSAGWAEAPRLATKAHEDALVQPGASLHDWPRVAGNVRSENAGRLKKWFQGGGTLKKGPN